MIGSVPIDFFRMAKLLCRGLRIGFRHIDQFPYKRHMCLKTSSCHGAFIMKAIDILGTIPFFAFAGPIIQVSATRPTPEKLKKPPKGGFCRKCGAYGDYAVDLIDNVLKASTWRAISIFCSQGKLATYLLVVAGFQGIQNPLHPLIDRFDKIFHDLHLPQRIHPKCENGKKVTFRTFVLISVLIHCLPHVWCNKSPNFGRIISEGIFGFSTFKLNKVTDNIFLLKVDQVFGIQPLAKKDKKPKGPGSALLRVFGITGKVIHLLQFFARKGLRSSCCSPRIFLAVILS